MPVVMNSKDEDDQGGVEATLSHDIPEASPEMNDEYEAKSGAGAPSSRRNLYYALGGLLALAVVALCIALPLALKDGDGNGSTFDSSADMIAAGSNINDEATDLTTEEKETAATATTTTTTITEEGDEAVQLPEVTSTSNADTDTYTFTTTTTTTTTGSGSSGTASESETETESTKTPSVTVNKEGDDIPDKEAETTVAAGAIDAGDVSSGTALLVGPDATLPLWGSGLTDGYSDDNEFERALIIAFRQQANTIIEQNIRNYQYHQQYQGGYGGTGGGPPPMAMGEMTFDESAPVPEAAGGASNMVADSAAASFEAAGAGGAERETVTDFGTNNQEENIDEADLIKADANYVYASYGDYIIIWDTAGNKVGQVQMPPIPTKEQQGLEEETHTEVKPEVQTVSSSNTKSSAWAPDFHYQPKPHINSMLLTANHLVALVDGYNNDPYYWGMGNSPREHVLSSYKACQVRLYEKDAATGNLNFLGSKDVNGNYVDARSIGDVVHLMTASGVDTWTHLGYPLDWWKLSDGAEISLDEYTKLANQHADTVVPEIAKKFVQELRLEDGSLPTLLQVNQWMSHTNKTENAAAEHSTTTTGPGFSLPYYQSYDVVSNVGQVTSFNVNSPLQITETATELKTTASAFLAPNYFNTMYGTDDYLVLATSGWDWNPGMQEGEQKTYVVALAIEDDDTTIFKSVGSLPGHLLNSYALDIVNDELRAATTVERFPDWWWGPPRPMPGGGLPFVEDVVMEEIPIETEPIEAAEAEAGGDSTVVSGELEALHNEEKATGGDGGGNNRQGQRKLRHRHLNNNKVTAKTRLLQADSCPTQDANPECVNETNYAECMELKDAACPEIAILESCPLQFACNIALTEPAGTNTAQAEDLFKEEPDISAPQPPPDRPNDDVSRTSNYMTVLKLIGEGVPAGQMSQKGQVKIGEKHERITSVRFFDNVAYAVTFERTDPFYVLDMNVPEVLGELKLPGFSSYLHSMNADNTLLLAVGQNATDDGRETGLMVTVFDATTPSAPKALVSHTFENDDNAYSGSSVQWDYKAFRYVDGKLVVPLEIWYSQQWDPDAQELLPIPEGAENFRGFAVLDVDTTAITEKYRISHMKPDGTCFYCDGGYIPQRSFVYAGDLMTVQEGVVVSTGLDSGEEKWRLTISVEGEPAECCW